AQWMMGNLATLLAEFGDRWPSCAKDLTDEVALGMFLSQSLYNLKTAAVAENLRVQSNEVMGRTFEQVDFVIAATNPGPAFAAESATSNTEKDLTDIVRSSTAGKYALRGALAGVRFAAAAAPGLPNWLLDEASRRLPDMVNMGALTILANIYGNPAVSIPAGTVDGLPVGMQVLGRHHEDALLFDVALAVERNRPWPKVAPPVGATTDRGFDSASLR
ncbi:MAG: hypothetical protein KDB02_08320, partial [Acidimicrobiales bacterium]|nr:hypothetical protein [Acidimicrobiales bacterium]